MYSRPFPSKKETAVHRLYEKESLRAYDIVLCDLSLKALHLTKTIVNSAFSDNIANLARKGSNYKTR